MSEIEERLNAVRQRINRAMKQSPYGEKVTLVAVTKFHPLEDMEEAIRLGVTQVGENRVQEMEMKHERLSVPVTWHLQGHLQKNKVKKAVAMADLIQSVDSLDILREIDKRAGQIGKVQDILLEFNISGEESKYGLAPKDFDEVVAQVQVCEHVRVKGLMCMAPEGAAEKELHAIFHQGRRMWEKLQTRFPVNQVSILSMGMSEDFETAIEEGATMVRIGTAIFGIRQKGEAK